MIAIASATRTNKRQCDTTSDDDSIEEEGQEEEDEAAAATTPTPTAIIVYCKPAELRHKDESKRIYTIAA